MIDSRYRQHTSTHPMDGMVHRLLTQNKQVTIPSDSANACQFFKKPPVPEHLVCLYLVILPVQLVSRGLEGQ